MTSIRTVGRAGALLFAIALLLAACGGNMASGLPASGGTGAASAAPSTAVVATPAAGTGESPEASFPFAIPSFDIGAMTKGLDKVDSYRITISVGGVEQYKGVVMTKPVLSRDITISGGTRIVVIGSDAWVAEGSGALKPVPAQLASSMFAAFDPTLMVGMFSGPEWAQSSADKGTEQKNGVSTHHMLIDSTTMAAGMTGLPAGASINLWIADEGYLVAWESTGTGGGDISIQVTGVDDPANKVERPG